MAIRGDTGRGSGRQKFIILTGPEDRRHPAPHRAMWGKLQGSQEAENNSEGKV